MGDVPPSGRPSLLGLLGYLDGRPSPPGSFGFRSRRGSATMFMSLSVLSSSSWWLRYQVDVIVSAVL
eukprot:12411312-Karenia_brevis.AAC.1